MPKYLHYKEMSAECGLRVRTLRSLKAQRKIPFVQLGYRTVVFVAEDVNRALKKFNVEAVS